MSDLAPSPRDEASGARDLLLELDLRRGRLRRNLRDALRAAISDGRLRPGTPLPASRRLAADLRVSRGVVSDAYEQLTAEGYLATRTRQAPLVAGSGEDAGHDPGGAADSAREPRWTNSVPDIPGPPWRFDFVATTPDIELFPRRPWLRALEHAMRDAPNQALDYGDHRGRIELRQALAAYLARVRGVRTTPERIIVTQGFTQALDLIARMVAAQGGRSIVVESPSLGDEWGTVRAAGLAVEPVPVDADGLRTDLLDAVAAAAVVVTPAHQFPTGAVMAPARRTALIEWAVRHGRLIVEDDYDAEFRYDRNPVGALQGLRPDHVIHVGTTAKTLAPGIRLGWMSIPAPLVDALRAAKGRTDSGSPAIDQLALAYLIETGEYDRAIARARHAYRHRRDALVASVRQRLPGLPIQGVAAGLHVLLRLPPASDDAAQEAAAASAGIFVRSLSSLSPEVTANRGLLLGFGRLPVGRIDAAVEALAACLAETGLDGVSGQATAHRSSV